MSKPNWLNIHTAVEAICQDNVATLRTSFLLLCDGDCCAAMTLDDFYFQTYSCIDRADPCIDSCPDLSCTTDIGKLLAMMSNIFSGEAVINALKLIDNLGYASIEISENYYVTYQLSLDSIHEELDRLFPQVHPIYPHVSSELPEPKEETPQELKPQRVRRNESKVVRFHNNRASSVALPATLTLKQWRQTLEDFDNKCAYCSDGNYEVLEHFIPLSFGGGTTVHNCVPACYRCNRAKSDNHPSMMPESSEITSELQRVQKYLQVRFGIEMAGDDYRGEL